MSTPPLTALGPRRNRVGEHVDALRRRKRAGPALYVLSVAVAALAYYGAGRIGLELAYLDGAVAALDRLPGWRRAYADAQAVVHIRNEPAAR